MPQRTKTKRDAPNRPAENTSDEKELVRFSLRYFLAMLVLLIVIFPFAELMPHGILILSLLMTLVLLSALPSIGGRRSTLVWGIALATPAVAGRWANYFRPDLVPPEIFLVAAGNYGVYRRCVLCHHPGRQAVGDLFFRGRKKPVIDGNSERSGRLESPK